MKRIIGLVIGGLAISGLLTAQTLNVQVGNVTYLFPASQAGSMPYESGTTLTVMGKSFTLSEIDNMYVDETAVRDSAVSVVYNGSSVAITVAGNIARYVTIAQSGTHVSIAQSSDLATEITYNLSGTSTNGEFYTSGEYKATLELNGLTLTNSTPVYSGAAIHVQNSKRINVNFELVPEGGNRGRAQRMELFSGHQPYLGHLVDVLEGFDVQRHSVLSFSIGYVY